MIEWTYLQRQLVHHRFQIQRQYRSRAIRVRKVLYRMMRSRTLILCRQRRNMRHLSGPCPEACRLHWRGRSRVLRGCQRHPITCRLAIAGSHASAFWDRYSECWREGGYQAPVRSWALENPQSYLSNLATCAVFDRRAARRVKLLITAAIHSDHKMFLQILIWIVIPERGAD